MIRCERDNGDGRFKVTFDIPAEGANPPVWVVGDFNGWNLVAMPLVRRGQRLRASVVLDAGRRYFFRYLAAGGHWFNDDAADDYEPNGLGGSDSVVDLTAPR